MSNVYQKKLNSLSGKSWVKLSKSTWITRKLLAWSGRVPLQAHSSFLISKQKYRHKKMSYRPLDETRVKLIELFTQPSQYVFDPCLQYGDSLAAALSINRQFVGIAENQQHSDDAVGYLEANLKNKPHLLLNQQSTVNPLTLIKNSSVDLLLTEIPIFDFKNKLVSYQQSLNDLKDLVEGYCQKLKEKAYMVLMVSDQRYQEQYYCRHADIIHVLESPVLKLQGVINVIQDSRALNAYGYPSTYVPNIINQYVLIFRNSNF